MADSAASCFELSVFKPRFRFSLLLRARPMAGKTGGLHRIRVSLVRSPTALLVALAALCVLEHASGAVSVGEAAALADVWNGLTADSRTGLALTWTIGDPCVDSWLGVQCATAPDRVMYDWMCDCTAVWQCCWSCFLHDATTRVRGLSVNLKSTCTVLVVVVVSTAASS